MSKEMKIKAIAPWFGAKRQLAAHIIELMGEHKAFWEPFCGSMAVLLAKPQCAIETVNDLHGDLINLAKVIRDPELGEQLYERAFKTLYAEDIFKDAKSKLAAPITSKEPDVDRAYNFFVMSWLGINGVSGTKRCNQQFAMRWCTGGGHGAKRWDSVVGSIPAWHKRLRNVVIINRDAFEIIKNIKDNTGTVIYCDPPYIEKGAKYLHDFSELCHGDLAGILGRFEKAHVLVSYYDHPKLDEIYLGWTKIRLLKTRASLQNASQGRQTKTMPRPPEIILSNRAISQEAEPVGLFPDDELDIDDETDLIISMEDELNG